MLCVNFPAVAPTIFNNMSMNKPSRLSSHNYSRIKSRDNNNNYYCGGVVKRRMGSLIIKSSCGTGGAHNQLPEGLEKELMPKHVAVIMDGNRRWAKSRGLPVQLGHIAGRRAMKQLTRNCKKFGVQVLTVFAFSTENWIRPKEEVDFLMNLFEEVIRSDMEELIQNDVRVSVVGNVGGLRPSLQSLITSSSERSKDNKAMDMVTALNYSGRYDITEATKQIARKVKDGVLGSVEDIDETLIEKHLQTNVIEESSFRNPDLLIRTSGELRLSNFMLWQSAYTELIFVDKLFPDFNEADLVDALTLFQKRQRRYGGHKY
ncbi:hypothetical protein ABFS83_11G132600 [Erythranthe nasuta]